MTEPGVITPETSAPKRGILRWLLGIAGALALLLVLAVFGVRLYFNDAYLKTEMLAALKQALGRDVEVRTFETGLLNGSLRIEGLRIINPDPDYVEKETVRIETIEAGVSLIPLLLSGGRSVRNLEVRLTRPVIIVERRGVWPMDELSIDDLLRKLTGGPPGAWPKHTGLRNASATIAVRNGLFRFIDRSTNLGDSEIQNITLDARLPALGEPLQTKVSFELNTPNSKAPGAATLEGKSVLLGADGALDPAAFKDVNYKFAFAELDLPHLARYARVQGKLSDGRFVWSMGKPVSGSLNILAPTMDDIRFTTVQETDGLISIWEKGQWRAGNLPSRLDCSLQAKLHQREFVFGPLKLDAIIAQTRTQLTDPNAVKLLETSIIATPGAADSLGFKVRFNTKMDELFATDVGAVLELKDRIGGDMDGNVDATFAAGGHIKLDGVFKTRGGYVMAKDVRLPTSFEVTFGSNVKPNEDGTPERAELTFNAKAGSFDIGSRQPVVITSLNNPQNLGAQARLQLHVRGREFWKEFGPLLQVANLSTPLEEALDGEIVVTGNPGKLGLQVDCTLQQQRENPTPILLSGKASYDGTALIDEPTTPYLSFDLRLNSAADKSIDLRLAGNATRGKKQHVVDLPTFSAFGDLKALNLLNQRIGAYVSVLFGPQYTAAGFIKQSGKSRLTQTLHEDGAVNTENLVLSTELQLAEFSLQGPPLLPNKAPLQWHEAEPATLKLSISAERAGGVTTLAIPELALNSKSLTLAGTLSEADQGKLYAAAKRGQLRAWMEALPHAKIDTHVSAEALQRLQTLGVLESDPLLIGELWLKAEYDPRTRLAKVPTLRFCGAHLEFSGALSDASLPAAVALLESKDRKPAQILSALPSLSIEAIAQPPLVARLQTEQLFPNDPALRGTVTLKASLDRAKGQLNVETFKYSGAAGDVALTGNNLSVPKLLKADSIADVLEAVGEATLSAAATPELFRAFRNLKWLPATPEISGTLIVNANYSGATDKLALQQLHFERTGTLPLLKLEAASELEHFRALVTKSPDDPLALLAHAGKGLSIKELTLDPVGVCALLKEQGHSDAWLGAILSGRCKPAGNWSIHGLVLKPAPQAGVLELSFAAQTPLTTFADARPVASLIGTWNASGVQCDLRPGQRRLEGVLNFDAAQLSCNAAQPYFTYAKSAGTAASLSFSLQQDTKGGIHAPRIALAGGPLNFDLANLYITESGKGSLISLQKLALGDGPLPGTLTNLAIDTGADHASGQLALGDLNLGKFASYATLPPGLAVSGTLNDTRISYDGRLSAFSSAFTATDKLTLQCALQDVKVSASTPGENAALTIAGPLVVDTTKISSNGFAVNLVYNGPNKVFAHHIFSLPLEVFPKAQHELLLNALQQPGLPVIVRAPAKAQSVIDINTLTRSLEMLAAAASPGPAKAGSMDGIKHLRVESAVSTPQLYTGGPVLADVQVPSLVFDELLVRVPKASASAFGGQLLLSDGAYNLTRMPLAHSQAFTLVNVDLHQLLDDPAHKPDKNAYQVFGRMIFGGRLSGQGFSQAERRTWQGDLTLKITDLVAQRGDGKPSDSLSDSAKKFGLGLSGAVLGMNGATAQIGRAMLIYSDDFGLFLNKLEFEPVEGGIALQNGVATVAGCKLVGKNRSAGLQIDVAGLIALPTETFAPRLNLWLAKLPPRTQEMLRMTQLQPQDRQTLVDEFVQQKFQPVQLSGPLSNPAVNTMEIVEAFKKLDDRIDAMLKGKPAAAPQPATPAQTQPTTEQPKPKEPAKEPEKKKGLDVFDLIDALDKKKKKDK